ncbi:alpha-2-macroglobulin family protein [Maritimibacter sp. DP1N21-5]|uniref:alpha-2-macroglobulin family protein n=1 Tax=Maritimibacter sp. DP1N21-5 TaxID=2836867 RepID=UPI001C48E7CD|nr:alpha-2-macroglobulin family protein [Maritimibacter sp. DP1N21-5]MBV7408282.1 alpha-2-macroglobulin family protein [Maritimibacter sp. DP1N21-5]
MRFTIILGMIFINLAGIAAAQETVPERRYVLHRDVDFFGQDLRSLFDTTLDTCESACLGNTACAAFTYNTRNASCFLKSGVTDQSDYAGAFSGEVFTVPDAIRANARAREAELTGFLYGSDLSRAADLAGSIPDEFVAGGWSAGELRQTAYESERDGNPGQAMRYMGAATVVSDAGEDWLEYSRLTMAVAGLQSDGNDARSYRATAKSAAIAAYVRLESPATRANALILLADILEDSDRGRDMIDALRLAQDLSPRDDTARALDRAIGLYGFRVEQTTVNADNAQPSICVTFTEELAESGTNYADFVQSDVAGISVEATNRQLCIAGVEHGGRYTFTLRAGLPSADRETLRSPVEITQYVRDRSPGVHFPARAYVLPRTEDAGLPIVSVNAETLDLTLFRISDRNLLRTMQNDFFNRSLDYWSTEYFKSEMAEEVWTGTATVGRTINEDVTTRLPIGEAIENQPAGIYALKAAVPGEDEYDSPPAVQWFVISDIGVTTMTGADGLHVFTRSLTSAGPMDGVEVELLSVANSVIGTTTTDAEGYAHFPQAQVAGLGSSAPGLVVLRAGEDDMAFLSLTDPAFDLSDRGVEGHPAAPPIDVFLTTDRGAYRAGEVVNATVLTRDGLSEAIEGLPITAILTRPDGVEYARNLSEGSVAGGHVFHLPIAGNAPRGTWRLDVHADPDAPALASSTLLVEDFLPERIDFDLALPDGPIALTDSPDLTVEARYLFGAPGADLAFEGDVRLTPVTTLAAFPGYRFGISDERQRPVYGALANGRTDVEGRASVSVDFPEVEANGRPLEAEVILRVKEGSGRPVERSIDAPVTPESDLIGIRPLFEDEVPESTTARFELIGLSPTLEPKAMEATWTLNRVTTRYQWYNQDGYWDWEPVTTRSAVDSGSVTLGPDPVAMEAPVDWGNYELVVTRTDGSYLASSLAFYAGWYVPADVSQTPDMLDMSLDAQSYRPGDTARLRIEPRMAGTALVTVVSNRLIDMIPVEVGTEPVEVEIPVTDDWGAGAYVTASLVQPLDETQGRNPARAMGLAHALVDPGNHRLSVIIDAPEAAQPRGPMEVSVRVEGVEDGDTAYVTLAAIDQGILNLTAFEDPEPTDHYFGQKRLGMEIRDIYGRLIDGMTGDMGQIRSGGDASAEMRMQAPPPTEELMAQFFGPVEVIDDVATVTVDLPEFNGSVRLMAVAWSETGVGEAGEDVLVRDPVVLTASVPRFMAPGDTARMLLELTHADGPVGEVSIQATAGGLQMGGDAARTVTLGEGETRRLEVPIGALSEGLYQIALEVTTPGGKRLTKTLTIPVQSNDPEIARTARIELAAGDTFTLSDDIFDNLRSGSARATLAAGPIAKVDAAGLLARLDEYPYGCTEQQTSRALPLLYMGGVAEAMGLADREDLPARIQGAIAEVLANQSSSGSFGLWRPDSGDLWLDAFVSDFLSRAKAQGYAIPDTAFRAAMDNLRNQVNYYPDFEEGGEDIAYALYVLAREGAANMGDLRYFADVKPAAFTTPMGAAQIGAALAAYGDPTRADRMFAQANRMVLEQEPEGQLWRADYGTNLRDAAAVLTLALEAGSEAVDQGTLVTRIAANDGRWSTQEATWSLLAANAMLGQGANAGLSLNGNPMTGPLVEVMNPVSLSQPWQLSNEGDAPVDLTITTFGVPVLPEPPTANGFVIERQYFTMEGAPADVSRVTQGERLVTLITVTPDGDTEGRLMVDDPLPAGFEIDNPNLLRAGDIGALDWLDLTEEVETSEFRQERFLTAVDWRSSAPIRLAYIVRAVTPGEFHHPAPSVEDMYRPNYRATGATGTVVIQ